MTAMRLIEDRRQARVAARACTQQELQELHPGLEGVEYKGQG